jgi:single-stranded DNA-binding protein
MNLCTLIVQIISKPKECFKNENIYLVEIQVQLAKLKKKKGFDKFKIYIWGNLGEKVVTHFRVGDYIIIEGVLSFASINSNTLLQKQIKFTVFNIYPFLLVDID